MYAYNISQMAEYLNCDWRTAKKIAENKYTKVYRTSKSGKEIFVWYILLDKTLLEWVISQPVEQN